MKNFFLLTMIFFSSQSFASSIQLTCSDATGMINISLGHFENGVKLTAVDSETGEKTVVPYTHRSLIVESKNNTILNEKIRNSCDGNDIDMGTKVTTTHYTEFLIMTNKNGTAFPDDIYGVAVDGSAVSGWVICKRVMDGEVPCD